MDRRAFFAGSLGLLAAPLAAEAQQGGRVYRLGLLSGGKTPQGPVTLIALGWDQTSAELRTLGYEEGRNLVLEARFADGQVDRHCHLGLGALYRRTGKRQQAQEYLANAVTLYREMDMRFWLEQAEAEMRELA
jgi:hypothetical protein